MKKLLISILALALMSGLAFAQDPITKMRGAETPIEDGRVVGHWVGNGQVTSNWADIDKLKFDITINVDGTIAGKIGDAEIVDGWARAMKMESDTPVGNKDRAYVVVAHLGDSPVKGEAKGKNLVEHRAFELFFDYYEGKLMGEFRSAVKAEKDQSKPDRGRRIADEKQKGEFMENMQLLGKNMVLDKR